MTDRLKLKLGDVILHHKRGSTYEVFARTVMQDDGCEDGQWMFFTLRDDPDENNAYHCIIDAPSRLDRKVAICLPLLAQTSEPGHGRDSKWLIYRSFGGEPNGDSMFFARPEIEFTDDRFAKVSE